MIINDDLYDERDNLYKTKPRKYQILNYEHGLDELTGRGRVDWGIEQAASGRWTSRYLNDDESCHESKTGGSFTNSVSIYNKRRSSPHMQPFPRPSRCH